jgi:SulP family sulfate permease
LFTASSSFTFSLPESSLYLNAFFLLVLPQLPLTLGNAVIGTADTCFSLFGKGEKTDRINVRALSTGMGIANIFAGLFCGMPMCHGAGGLAAHYRFGARTGGSNIIIGAAFLVLALLFGSIGISLIRAIPHGILGVFLIFAGLELSLLIRDVKDKADLFAVFFIAVLGLVTTNMGIAFTAGIMLSALMKWRRIEM